MWKQVVQGSRIGGCSSKTSPSEFVPFWTSWPSQPSISLEKLMHLAHGLAQVEVANHQLESENFDTRGR